MVPVSVSGGFVADRTESLSRVIETTGGAGRGRSDKQPTRLAARLKPQAARNRFNDLRIWARAFRGTPLALPSCPACRLTARSDSLREATRLRASCRAPAPPPPAPAAPRAVPSPGYRAAPSPP